MSDIDAVIAWVREVTDPESRWHGDDIDWLKTLVANTPGVSLIDNDRAQNVLDAQAAEIADLRARVDALTAALTDIMQDIANYGVPPRETQERARAALAGKE